MNFNKKNVVVLGAGESGEGALNLLQRLGAKTYVFDENEEKAKKLASNYNANHLNSKNLPETMAKAYCVILSPGIDVDSNYVVMAKALGLKVIPEIELASMQLRGKNISVTGTNGKSSSVRLITSVLNFCGKFAVSGGNIGTAFSRFADKLNAQDIAVIETSSFQLETTENYHADVAVILNVTSDHINRHKDLQKYIDAKKKLIANSTQSDYVVANFDDKTVKSMINEGQTCAQIFYFSKSERVDQGVYINGENITAVIHANEYVIGKLCDVTPLNTHIENVLATLCVALIYNLPIGSVYKKIREFVPDTHTLRKINTINGIDYVDDSKGTNVSATLHAVKSTKGKLALIVGGREKGEDYSVLFQSLPDKVKQVVFLGENADKLYSVASNLGIKGAIATDMQNAVFLATETLDGEGTVLFSPACASFDRYENYKKRGEDFACVVNSYEQK